MLNKMLGYETPADIVYKFPHFYWTNVAPQIRTAITVPEARPDAPSKSKASRLPLDLSLGPN
jgi:hypothetical protein